MDIYAYQGLSEAARNPRLHVIARPATSLVPNGEQIPFSCFERPRLVYRRKKWNTPSSLKSKFIRASALSPYVGLRGPECMIPFLLMMSNLDEGLIMRDLDLTSPVSRIPSHRATFTSGDSYWKVGYSLWPNVLHSSSGKQATWSLMHIIHVEMDPRKA
jgi:hypothetical protein